MRRRYGSQNKELLKATTFNEPTNNPKHRIHRTHTGTHGHTRAHVLCSLGLSLGTQTVSSPRQWQWHQESCHQGGVARHIAESLGENRTGIPSLGFHRRSQAVYLSPDSPVAHPFVP